MRGIVKLKSRKPTKADKERFELLAQIGCIICGKPCEIHHKTGAGMGLRADHQQTMGLCPYHHRTGNFGEAVHNGTKTFEKNFGTQDELIQKCNKAIEKLLKDKTPAT